MRLGYDLPSENLHPAGTKISLPGFAFLPATLPNGQVVWLEYVTRHYVLTRLANSLCYWKLVDITRGK